MAKAIFTTSESSDYDDLPEYRYHFPRTYLRQARDAVGDLIVYYEPRRTTGRSSSTGRQAYFAVARVREVAADPKRPDHFYAYVEDYLEFDRPVGFRRDGLYLESMLRKDDGTTNKGAFGRSVRALPDAEFEAIVRAGFSRPPEELAEWERRDALLVREPEAAYPERPIVTQLVQRPFREEAFRRQVREAYDNKCAITGLRLVNGGGRPEVQAAHIRPVADRGPDSVRNGLALTGTMHWLFDRGLVSVADDYTVLISPKGLPDDLARLIRPDRKLLPPARPEVRPHPSYLRWHRQQFGFESKAG